MTAIDREIAIRLFNAGYKAGHYDTVEAQYTDIADCDMGIYHDDFVDELLFDAKIGMQNEVRRSAMVAPAKASERQAAENLTSEPDSDYTASDRLRTAINEQIGGECFTGPFTLTNEPPNQEAGPSPSPKEA